MMFGLWLLPPSSLCVVCVCMFVYWWRCAQSEMHLYTSRQCNRITVKTKSPREWKFISKPIRRAQTDENGKNVFCFSCITIFLSFFILLFLFLFCYVLFFYESDSKNLLSKGFRRSRKKKLFKVLLMCVAVYSGICVYGCSGGRKMNRSNVTNIRIQCLFFVRNWTNRSHLCVTSFSSFRLSLSLHM